MNQPKVISLPSCAHDSSSPTHQSGQELDHFVVRGGKSFAGTHVIVDLIGAQGLTDQALMETTFLRCIEACKATLLHMHVHRFLPSGGLSGVAVLAESHISVHTWPERDYAAFDVFMCGDAEPEKAVSILKEAFQAEQVNVQTFFRGEGVSE